MAPIVYNKPRGWHLHTIHTGSAGKKDTNHNNGLNIQPFCFLGSLPENICKLLLKQIDVSFSILWRWHDAHHADSYIFVQFIGNTTQTQWSSLVSINLMNGTHIVCYWTHFQPENQKNLQNSADLNCLSRHVSSSFCWDRLPPDLTLVGFETSQVTRFTALMGCRSVEPCQLFMSVQAKGLKISVDQMNHDSVIALPISCLKCFQKQILVSLSSSNLIKLCPSVLCHILLLWSVQCPGAFLSVYVVNVSWKKLIERERTNMHLWISLVKSFQPCCAKIERKNRFPILVSFSGWMNLVTTRGSDE